MFCNERGGTNIILIMLISGLSLVYFNQLSSMHNNLSKKAHHISAKESLRITMMTVKNIVENSDVLFEAIEHESNDFECLLNETCTYAQQAQSLIVNRLDGTPLANRSTAGFDFHGQYCDSDNESCLFLLSILWRPLCESKTTCVAPKVLLYPEVTLNPKAKGSFKYNTASAAQGIRAVMEAEDVVFKIKAIRAIQAGQEY